MAGTHHGDGLTRNGDLQGATEALTGRHGVEKLVYVFDRAWVLEIGCCKDGMNSVDDCDFGRSSWSEKAVDLYIHEQLASGSPSSRIIPNDALVSHSFVQATHCRFCLAPKPFRGCDAVPSCHWLITEPLWSATYSAIQYGLFFLSWLLAYKLAVAHPGGSN